ncbi:hypothetical protein J7439_20350 [Salinisphaera sp. G21_0]|nr:hypothetical protein [Salinisphaera sp. G21_0]
MDYEKAPLAAESDFQSSHQYTWDIEKSLLLQHHGRRHALMQQIQKK